MKQVRICLGRFQPFTLGHLKMATYKCKGPETLQGFKGSYNQKELLREQPDIKEINKQKTLILVVRTTPEQVDKRHPFDENLMKEEMDMVKKYPEIEDVMFVDSADICAWGEMIKKAGYQASVWITGSDEAKPYVEMAMKVPEYEEHNRDNRDCKNAYTKSFYIESINRNDSSDDYSETISGTKVREAIMNDDKETYSKMMPKGCNKLFDKFKEALFNPNLPEKYKKPTKKKIKEYLNINLQPISEFLVKLHVKKEKLFELFLGITKTTNKTSQRMYIKVYTEDDALELLKINSTDFTENQINTTKKILSTLDFPCMLIPRNNDLLNDNAAVFGNNPINSNLTTYESKGYINASEINKETWKLKGWFKKEI